MRKIIILLSCSLISLLVIGQDDEDTFSPSKLESIAKNMKTIWDDGDADFTITATPEKWKDESGVIIAQKTKFAFDKMPTNWPFTKSHIAASN